MKRFEEIAKEKGKELLIESHSVSVTPENIIIPESTQLVESNNGQKYTCLGILKNVPVTRYTENLNGRIYSRSLWENVIRSGMAEGTDCLGDHPEGEGSVWKVCGIWHNFKLTENGGIADLYLIGSGGQLLLDKVRAGGKAGMSSVGYGEFLEDDKTVNPDTFELSRLSDWVQDPSQQVFATVTNLEEDQSEIKAESFNKIYTNKSDTLTEEIKMSNNIEKKVDKLYEGNINNQLDKIKEDIEDPKNLSRSQKQLKNLLETVPEEMVFLKEKVKVQFDEVNTKIKEYFSKTETTLKETTESFEDLKKKHEELTEAHKKVEAENKKLSEVVEKLGATKENPEKLKVVEGMSKDLKQFVEDRKVMEQDIKQLTEDRNTAISDVNNLVEDRKVMQEDISKLIKNIKLMEKDIKQFLHDRKVMEKDIRQLSKDKKLLERDLGIFKNELNNHIDLKEFVDSIVEDPAAMAQGASYGIGKDPMDNYASKSELQYPETIDGTPAANSIEDKHAKDYADMQNKMADMEDKGKDVVNASYQNEYEPMQNPNSENDYQKKYGHGDAVEPNMNRGVAPGEMSDVSDSYSDAYDGGPYGTGGYVDYQKQGLGESIKSIKNSISRYFQEVVRKTPAVADIKREIMASNSIMEAVKKVEKFLENGKQDSFKLTESYIKDSQDSEWLDGRL